MAFRSDWTGARLLSKSIAFVIILFIGFSVVANESDGIAQELETKATQPRHTVVVGDTLWNVALRLRPQGMAMAQAMDAVYEHNPEAFLEGDSTKLIEGSVVTFPETLDVVEASESVVSEENLSLTIPQLEPITEQLVESIELAPEERAKKQDNTVDDLSMNKALLEVEVEVEGKTHESLITAEQESEIQLPNAGLEALPIGDALGGDSQLLIDSTVQQKLTEVVFEQPSIQPIKTEFVSQLKRFWAQLKSQDVNQTIAKLKQLPIDLWFFVAAILIAIIINRSKRKSQDDSSSKPSTDPLTESVLDGPFAEGDDQDDVFTVTVEQPAETKVKEKSQMLEEDEPAEIVMNLPGLDELKAQLSEDGDQTKPLAKDYEPVSFEEDSLEIDPLQIKLDMASLCIEMGDIESAQSILEEIISEADKSGKAKAREILDSIET
jgi:FimV-like protein